MRTASFNVDGEPAVGLDALHNANFLLLGFEDGALFDVELEVGAHGESGVAGWRRAQITDAVEFGFHGGGSAADFA